MLSTKIIWYKNLQKRYLNIYVIKYTKAYVITLFTLLQIKEKYEPLFVSIDNVCCILCVPF